jgi:hypothetical protein
MFSKRIQALYLLGIIVSVLLTVMMFLGVVQVPIEFLGGIVTVDSFLIAVVALVVTLTIRIMGLDKQLEEFRKGELPRILISMGIVWLPLVVILGFFLSAMLALESMLRTGSLALELAVASFWLMLCLLLEMLVFLWTKLGNLAESGL